MYPVMINLSSGHGQNGLLKDKLMICHQQGIYVSSDLYHMFNDVLVTDQMHLFRNLLIANQIMIDRHDLPELKKMMILEILM